MRRLPHVATLLRPSTVTDRYGDEAAGPLAPVGDPFPAWQQDVNSEEADGVVRTRPVVHVFESAPEIRESDVLEVDGVRFRVEGFPVRPVNPRGRGRFVRVNVSRVTRGGS